MRQNIYFIFDMFLCHFDYFVLIEYAICMLEP